LRRPGLGLETIDGREDLGVLGKAIGLLVVVDALIIDVDEEDAAHAFLEVGGDPVLFLDGGLQTGGLGEVVSLAAVRDLDLHPILLWDHRVWSNVFPMLRVARE
jgi:hypothetical protein